MEILFQKAKLQRALFSRSLEFEKLCHSNILIRFDRFACAKCRNQRYKIAVDKLLAQHDDNKFNKMIEKCFLFARAREHQRSHKSMPRTLSTWTRANIYGKIKIVGENHPFQRPNKIQLSAGINISVCQLIGWWWLARFVTYWCVTCA